MDGPHFDALTKNLASHPSRRGVIKGIGGFVAAAFGLLGRETVLASNSDCAHFCNAVFPSGPARGTCKSDAAKHVPGNLCEACGADPGQVITGADEALSCCDPNLVCVAPSGAEVCCTTEQSCSESGECISSPPVCLLVPAPCDLADDRCCGTVNGDPDGSICTDVSDIYPELVSRCCIPPNTGIPCSGSGGNHCAPNSQCSICCTNLCGPADADGNAVCVTGGGGDA